MKVDDTEKSDEGKYDNHCNYWLLSVHGFGLQFGDAPRDAKRVLEPVRGGDNLASPLAVDCR